MKYTLLILSWYLLLGACTQKVSKTDDDILKSAKASIEFFQNGYDPELGTYYSEVDATGAVMSDKVHTVAVSRMLYGLAFVGKYDADAMNKAQQLAKFQLAYMLGSDADGPYYLPTYSASETIAKPTSFDIWQQAYGNCGLAELYRATADHNVYVALEQNIESFMHRFKDDTYGGFYGGYSVSEGQIHGSKTLQSLMYPVTAFIDNLLHCHLNDREEYESIVAEIMEIAYRKVWDESSGWVNTKFTDSWEPMTGTEDQVSPGHNFQFASLLLRSKAWDFIPESKKQAYMDLGNRIIKRTLEKNIWENQNTSFGFYESVSRGGDQILSSNKSWWQHCEALIALSLSDDENKPAFESLRKFYFNTFIDQENGGEWAQVDKTNVPLVEPKGSLGKSVYHHIECLRFLMAYDNK